MAKNKNKNNQSGFTQHQLLRKSGAGFTLIELLVALVTFSLLMFSLTTIAASVIKAQRKTFAMQNIQEPARYILEVINKEIRLGEINSASSDNAPSLSITNFQDEAVNYQFSNNKIQRQVNGGVWQDLSPSNLEVTGGFYITNESFPKRAKVTTVMKIRTTEGQPESNVEINLQGAITPRSFK